MSVVGELLHARAAGTPAGTALVALSSARTVVWTWAELDRATAALAATAETAAARPGQSVLLLTAGNDAEALPELIAALRTDMPVAVLGRSPSEAEVSALREAVLRRGYDVVSLHGGHATATRSTRPTAEALPPESVLLSTGGSSGRPKVVVERWMRTVGRRPPATRPSSAMNWRAGQRQLVIGPLHHAAPLTYLLEGLSDGNTLIVPGAFDPPAVLAGIHQWRAEWFQLTPYHMRQLAAAMPRHGHDLSTVRGMLHIAAACPDQLKRHWLDLIEPDRVFEMYGATERIGVTIASGAEWLRRPGTVGRGFFTQIRIVDENGRRLPPGEVGEVYLRSGPPARRLYLDPGDGLKTTADGFVSVGDRGHLDADGYLYLGRRQFTRIQVGGETVEPGEVESVLLSHPDVLDAAVLGVPDERLGESVAALVVRADGRGVEAEKLRRYVRERVARHKVPRVIRLVRQLPYTEAGKLDRTALMAMLGMGGKEESDGHLGA
jgi:bile acid-coenzyme A ligase